MYSIDKICRICLKTINGTSPNDGSCSLDAPYEDISNSVGRTYREILSELTADSKEANDERLPKQICTTCEKEVTSSYRLRRKIISSAKILVNQLQRQEQLQEMDVAIDIESLHSSIVIIDNVVRVKTENCSRSCDDCSVSSCARRRTTTTTTKENNNMEIDSECRFCGANKSSCNICSVDELDIGALEVSSISPPPQPPMLEEEEEPEEDAVVVAFKCDECHKEFATKSRLKKHTMTHTPAKPFHCPHCKWSFATEVELNTHNLVNHTLEGKNECVYCHKAFKEKRLLRQHMITHKKQKRFHCKFCQKGFNLAHHLKNHEKIHENKSDFECELCKKRFITKDRLSSHLKTHQEKCFRCETCGKAFISEAALKIHDETHTNDDGTLICPGCGLQFMDAAKFNRHRKLQCVNAVKMGLNEGVKAICLVCSVAFDTEHAMHEHMKSHTNQFVCSTCHKSFLKESSLKTHMNSHTLRPYVCEVCEESFNRADHLKNHVARKHPTECDNEFRHPCTVCGKKFLQSGELNIHLRTHTNTKPFECGTCGRKFAQGNQLKNHERLHSDTRPYACSICSQSYASKSGLNQHLAACHTVVVKNQPHTLIFDSPTILSPMPEEYLNSLD